MPPNLRSLKPTVENGVHVAVTIEAFVVDKAWGCHGSIVVDARRKPHHAAPLLEDPAVTRRVDELFSKRGPLHRLE